jgi:anaerobic ribonucleoside-triphosphate reductase activating protein
MNYHDIKTDNMDNGDGVRVVLWVAGCNHHCKGCQNPQTWSSDSGKEFDKEAIHKILTELNKDYISGITLSGGDPLHPDDIGTIALLVKFIKDLREYKSKTIWLYTGYTFEQLLEFEYFDIKCILENIDVLVDGKFEEEYRDTTLMWRGSPNQRVIDVKKSLAIGKIESYIPLEKQVEAYLPKMTNIPFYHVK